MIAVSDAWKVKQTERLSPEGFVEIQYWMTDPGVQAEASATDNNRAYYASTAKITELAEKNEPKYATLERNLWPLDGSMELVPSSGFGDTGYISASMSTENAAFDVLLSITLSFATIHENVLPGISIVWGERYDEYATSFRISAYAGNTLIAEQLVTDNASIESSVEMDLSGYDGITIDILSWSLPYRRAKCSRIRLGVVHTLTKDALLGFEHTQSVDLLSASLPKNSIRFDLDNTDGKWNPENPSGSVRYLIERQELNVRYGLDIDGTVEWIQAGTFYMSEWNTPANGLEATFVARDLIEYMNEVYQGDRTGTLYDIAVSALEQANLPTDGVTGQKRYRIDEKLKELRADFYQDENEYTISEILQLVANAACCVLYQDRTGIFRIEPLKTAYGGYAINKHVSYTHPEYVISKKLKAVNVNDGLKIVPNEASGEVQTIRNPLIRTPQQADLVGAWVVNHLKGRKTLSGEYRADPRLDVLDIIAVESKYGTNNAVVVTDLVYSFRGAFRGKYTGRVVEFPSDHWYTGELYSGELG